MDGTMKRKTIIVTALEIVGIDLLALAGWMVRPEMGLFIAGVGLVLVTVGSAKGQATPRQAQAADLGNTAEILSFIVNKRKS
jgi:hypothetical protein